MNSSSVSLQVEKARRSKVEAAPPPLSSRSKNATRASRPRDSAALQQKPDEFPVWRMMRAQRWLGMLLPLVICGSSAAAAEVEASNIVVKASGEEFEDPGGYGQPQWAERSRASSTTKLYVLSPYEFFVGLLSESAFSRHGRTTHDLSQEIELGLPHRLEIGFENHLGLTSSKTEETMAKVEARYAFASWGKVLLNPAIAAGYSFGLDDQLVRGARRDQPDAYELRLLLGQEFVPRVQWAANVFFEQELSPPRNREAGFTQAVSYLLIADRLEVGTEMRYQHETHSSQHRGSGNQFIIGPSVSWKPNRHTVLDLAPLLGCTPDSPRLAAFITLSFEFGGAESRPNEQSGATRNR